MNRSARLLKILAIVIVGGIALSAIVMSLWNWLLPQLIPGIHQINYLQALGLFVLCRILFGGLRGGGRGWRMRGRWEQMSDEERRKFKDGMRAFHGGGRRGRGCGNTNQSGTESGV
jgi:hypothetical protein